VYGQTKKRLTSITRSPLVIVSRVGDEGVSLQQLQQVIEFDFLFGSRRQELQRLGRLFHSNFTGDHIILMTEEEYGQYKKRLYSIYEKGIDIIIEQR
jgi:superfamily II DNA or RNA helicase